jgi:HEPN domain-containing protein
MSVNDDARRMYKIAQRDLRTIRAMRNSEDFGDYVFGFHAQQAVEKLLKAWLWALDQKPPYTHDLDGLIELLERLEVKLPGQFRELAGITEFAVQFRYIADEIFFPFGRDEAITRIEALAAHLRQIFPAIEKLDIDL